MTNVKIATYQERAKKLEDVLKSELPCVIRLGGTKEYPEYKLQINSSKAVENCINKYESKKILSKNSISTMPVLNPDFITFPCVVKGIIRSQGSSVFVVENEIEYNFAANKLLKGKFYVEPLFKTTSEYRLHCTKDDVFFSVKKLKNEDKKDDILITAKNHHNTRDFVKPRLWDKMKDACIATMKAHDLEIGAIDVGYCSEGEHSFVIHEVNTNPELLKNTFDAYAETLQKLINNKQQTL